LGFQAKKGGRTFSDIVVVLMLQKSKWTSSRMTLLVLGMCASRSGNFRMYLCKQWPRGKTEIPAKQNLVLIPTHPNDVEKSREIPRLSLESRHKP